MRSCKPASCGLLASPGVHLRLMRLAKRSGTQLPSVSTCALAENVRRADTRRGPSIAATCPLCNLECYKSHLSTGRANHEGSSCGHSKGRLIKRGAAFEARRGAPSTDCLLDDRAAPTKLGSRLQHLLQQLQQLRLLDVVTQLVLQAQTKGQPGRTLSERWSEAGGGSRSSGMAAQLARPLLQQARRSSVMCLCGTR